MQGDLLEPFDLTPEELELCKRALTDGFAGKPALDLNEWGPKVQILGRDRAARVAAREKGAAAQYLAKAAAAAGARRGRYAIARPVNRPKKRPIMDAVNGPTP